jgi:hypothetical protein
MRTFVERLIRTFVARLMVGVPVPMATLAARMSIFGLLAMTSVAWIRGARITWAYVRMRSRVIAVRLFVFVCVQA